MNAPINDITMSKTEFSAIADIAYNDAGLVFKADKASLVSTRIRRRVRSLGLDGFSNYIAYVTSHAGESERRTMISSLTTNVSHFFRENHHFEYLKSEIFPKLITHAQKGGRVRLWSAGCSTGQEPYSMALIAYELDSNLPKYDFKILATDIDQQVIETGKEGYYSQDSLPNINSELILANASHRSNKFETGFSFNPNIKNLITFRDLNLLHNWPFAGQFDVIFCRNVVIYFDQKTQQKLWPRFAAALNTGGCLFVGHSERFTEETDVGFHMVGPTTYQLKHRK